MRAVLIATLFITSPCFGCGKDSTSFRRNKVEFGIVHTNFLDGNGFKSGSAIYATQRLPFNWALAYERRFSMAWGLGLEYSQFTGRYEYQNQYSPEIWVERGFSDLSLSCIRHFQRSLNSWLVGTADISGSMHSRRIVEYAETQIPPHPMFEQHGDEYNNWDLGIGFGAGLGLTFRNVVSIGFKGGIATYRHVAQYWLPDEKRQFKDFHSNLTASTVQLKLAILF